jgi:acyl-CoA reductase-like NAD-dependent aldehyde dehydrogenase
MTHDEATSLEPVRLRVQKAYKMFVGGQFIRSESGRVRAVTDAMGDEAGLTENVPRASRKDARDAVIAAHTAFGGWSSRTAYNRGQILYRLSEVMEGRATELAKEIHRSLGASFDEARREVDTAIDRVISFAGWTDKVGSLLATSNPVSGPHFNFTVPEAMGIVAVVTAPRPSLLGLVTAIAPIVATGNTCVVLVSEDDPRTPLTFAECLATSDMPGGVVNLLSAPIAEVAPHLAKHQEVAALDLWNLDDALAAKLEVEAVATVKRVRRHNIAADRWADESLQGLRTLERFLEQKTVWHPVGI